MEFNDSWDFDLNGPEAIFQEGMDLLESDHFEEALQAFDRLLNQEPDHADALFHRGISLINLGRVDEARHAYEQAVKLSPTESQYRSHLGYAHMLSGDPESAMAEFDYALVISPDAYQNRVYKACVMAEIGDLSAAAELIEDVLSNYPDDFEARKHYASMLFGLDRLDESVAEFLKVLSKRPNHTESIRRLAEVYLRLERTPEAMARLHEYLTLNPMDTRAWELLLRIRAHRGDNEAVLALCEEAAESGIESAEICYYRGRAHFEMNSWTQAYPPLVRARRLDPELADVHFLIARILLDQNRYRSALASASRALSLSPSDGRYLVLKAGLHHQLGEFEAEAQVLRMLLLKSPEDFDIVRMAVENYLSRNCVSDAIAVVERYLAHRPTDIRGLLCAAELRDKAGDKAGALRHYRKMEEHSKATARTFYSYASFLFRSMDSENALRVLDIANRRFPEDAPLRILQAASLQAMDRHQECLGALANLNDADITPEVLVLRARSLYFLRQYESALACFREIREREGGVRPGVAGSRLLMAEAHCLHKTGHSHEALELVRSDQNPTADQPIMRAHLVSEMLEACDQIRQALDVCLKALADAPDQDELHARAARCAARLRDPRLMTYHIRQAVALDKKHGKLLAEDLYVDLYRHRPAVASALRLETFRDVRIYIAIAVTALAVWSIIDCFKPTVL